MWQAFVVIGGMVFAIGIKVVMEVIKLREEPERSEVIGKPINFADRATAACQRCGSKDVVLYPDRWYVCRSCDFGGQL